jgi:hypothetical protein
VFRFSVRQDTINENYFVVDIGGGSTDIFISLIDVNNVRDYNSTSLEFGARRILIKKLLHNDAALLRQLMNKFADRFVELGILDPTKYIKGFAERNKNSMVRIWVVSREVRNLGTPKTNQAAFCSSVCMDCGFRYALERPVLSVFHR